MTRDRIDYSTAIGESWKHQTLLNIVKLRYGDAPLFLDVGQIVSGYTLETSLSLGLNRGAASSGGGRFTDRPTVTYQPLTGDRFISGLVTPIAPASLVSGIEAGWPADTMLPIGVASINGIPNEEFVSGQYRAADPRFGRVAALLRRLQLDGDVSFRIEKRDKDATTLLAFGRPNAESRATSDELRALLGLDPGVESVNIVFGDLARNGQEVAVRTRSILNVLQVMSSHTAVPMEHVSEGRASPGAPEGAERDLRGFRILSAANEPEDAFVSVRYHDTWFYVSDRDLRSKSVLSFLILLFTLADTGSERAGPVLTIPTQ